MTTEEIAQAETRLRLFCENPEHRTPRRIEADTVELIAEVRRLREIIAGQRPAPCPKCDD